MPNAAFDLVDWVYTHLDPRETKPPRDHLIRQLSRALHLAFRNSVTTLARDEIGTKKKLPTEVISSLLDSIDIFVQEFLSGLRFEEKDRLRESSPSASAIPEEFDSAKDELRQFIKDYVRNDFRTLHGHLTNSKRLYRSVNHFELFDEDMIAFFKKQMFLAVVLGVHQEFDKFLKSNRELFLTDILLRRVVGLDTKGTPVVNKDFIPELLNILAEDSVVQRILTSMQETGSRVDPKDIDEIKKLASSQGEGGSRLRSFELSSIYMLLYVRLYDMTAVWREQVGVRHSVRTDIPDLIPDDGIDSTSLFDLDFDFDTFFHRHFGSAITHAQALRLPKKHVRILDVMSTEPDSLLCPVIPEKGLKPVREIADLSEKDFAQFIRHHLNYTHIPSAENGLNFSEEQIIEIAQSLGQSPDVEQAIIRVLKDRFHKSDKEKSTSSSYVQLSDSQMNELIGHQLNYTSEFLKYIRDDALKVRPHDDHIREDCQYIPQIIECRDLHQLFEWYAYPKKLLEKFPETDVRPEIVRRQAQLMIGCFFFYRRHIFRPEVKELHDLRAFLEDHFQGRLNLDWVAQNTFIFRIKEEIDPETHAPILDTDGNHKYDVASADNSLYFNVQTDEEIIIEENGRTYRLYPQEEKVFTDARVTIPSSNGNPPKTGMIRYYSPDGNLIHQKSWQAYLASILRGKTPHDGLRGTIITEDKQMESALRDLYYNDYSSGQPVAVEDKAEGRRKASHVPRTSGSARFDANRGFAGGFYATPLVGVSQAEIDYTFSIQDPEEKKMALDRLNLKHTHIGFEPQIMEMKPMLLALSDYTSMSHSRTYEPERFWPLFSRIFDPYIYGRRVAEHIRDGFRGKQKAA